jgi:GLPGLI family protein
MKTFLLTAICLLLISNTLLAQNARFTGSGIIEYEKSVNMFALIQKYINNYPNPLAQQAFDKYKGSQPQFKNLKSTLTFSDNKTLFTPMAAPESTFNNFFIIPIADQNSITYTDLSANTYISQKKFFDETLLIKDTIRKIKWKITGETREIAGYPCRRANGLALDSVYVVAFYTDKIPVSGGPESFGGLPGMILQVVLPHENVNWIAAKVTDSAIPSGTMIPPKKGKPMTIKQFYDTLTSLFKTAPQLNSVLKDYSL